MMSSGRTGREPSKGRFAGLPKSITGVVDGALGRGNASVQTHVDDALAGGEMVTSANDKISADADDRSAAGTTAARPARTIGQMLLAIAERDQIECAGKMSSLLLSVSFSMNPRPAISDGDTSGAKTTTATKDPVKAEPTSAPCGADGGILANLLNGVCQPAIEDLGIDDQGCLSPP
jgi:hypothetical protein